MKATVLFFATLKDKTGTGSTEITLPDDITVKAFKNVLVQVYPSLQPHIGTVLVSINHEFAFDDEGIPHGAEIAVFPPVSGGSGLPTICQVTNDAVDTDALVSQITLPSTGAACIFTGIVRGETTRGQAFTTLALEYEAYIPMAEAKMHQVADEIRARWPQIEGLAIVQRIGHLEPGQLSTWIVCTAAHRDTGVFEAAHYGIDRLKEIVPIWKKEIGSKGQVWIEGAYQPKDGD